MLLARAIASLVHSFGCRDQLDVALMPVSGTPGGKLYGRAESMWENLLVSIFNCSLYFSSVPLDRC